MILHRIIFPALGIVFLAACDFTSLETERISLPKIEAANEFRVINNHGYEILTEHNQQVVLELLDKVNLYTDNWGKPLTGAPVALQKIEFYLDNKNIGSFGLGSNFFTRGYLGFYSRPANEEQLRELRNLIGVANPYK